MKGNTKTVHQHHKGSAIPNTGRSGVGEGRTGGRALLFLCAGWVVGGVAATSGSSSHGETLSGRGMDEGSSHCTWI